MSERWQQALPHPIAFVLSGGATLGALQVGMLRALEEVGLQPDLVVGTSVGALNGAVVAEHGELAPAEDRLLRVWCSLERGAIFPGSVWGQARRVLNGRSLHPDKGLRSLVERTLTARQFEDLSLPLGVLATGALTAHPRLLTSGDLTRALLASAAIPGVLPPVRLAGEPHWDGGLTANVPLRSAQRLGAGSLVVLDAGSLCHRRQVPRRLPDVIAGALQVAIRQRVLVEAPMVAAELPVLYLPRPCVGRHDVLDFGDTADLIATARGAVVEFLADVEPPVAGRMIGSPHTHEDEDLEVPISDPAPAPGEAAG